MGVVAVVLSLTRLRLSGTVQMGPGDDKNWLWSRSKAPTRILCPHVGQCCTRRLAPAAEEAPDTALTSALAAPAACDELLAPPTSAICARKQKAIWRWRQPGLCRRGCSALHIHGRTKLGPYGRSHGLTTAVLQQHYYLYYQSCAAHNPRVARWLSCTMVYYGDGLCRRIKIGLNGAFWLTCTMGRQVRPWGSSPVFRSCVCRKARMLRYRFFNCTYLSCILPCCCCFLLLLSSRLLFLLLFTSFRSSSPLSRLACTHCLRSFVWRIYHCIHQPSFHTLFLCFYPAALLLLSAVAVFYSVASDSRVSTHSLWLFPASLLLLFSVVDVLLSVACILFFHTEHSRMSHECTHWLRSFVCIKGRILRRIDQQLVFHSLFIVCISPAALLLLSVVAVLLSVIAYNCFSTSSSLVASQSSPLSRMASVMSAHIVCVPSFEQRGAYCAACISCCFTRSWCAFNLLRFCCILPVPSCTVVDYSRVSTFLTRTPVRTVILLYCAVWPRCQPVTRLGVYHIRTNIQTRSTVYHRFPTSKFAFFNDRIRYIRWSFHFRLMNAHTSCGTPLTLTTR